MALPRNSKSRYKFAIAGEVNDIKAFQLYVASHSLWSNFAVVQCTNAGAAIVRTRDANQLPLLQAVLMDWADQNVPLNGDKLHMV